jgi:hypothetical protein
MVLCDCTQCGGKDEFAMCENGMLENMRAVGRAQRWQTRLLILAIVLIGAALLLELVHHAKGVLL